MRTRGLPLSKAQMTPSGLKVPTIFMNMLKKPKRAFVARPSGADIGWRIAWKARCMSELPSITAMVRRDAASASGEVYAAAVTASTSRESGAAVSTWGSISGVARGALLSGMGLLSFE